MHQANSVAKDPFGRPEGSDPGKGQGLNLYAIGLGSNRPISAQLFPRDIIQSAMVALDLPPLSVLRRSSIIVTRPIGPSQRCYANATVLVASPLPPLAMLAKLQAIEARFHRRRFRRWGDRTLDLDLLLWSGGMFTHRRLTIPHKSMRERAFVLGPLRSILPRWRDPVSGHSIAQLSARLGKGRRQT